MRSIFESIAAMAAGWLAMMVEIVLVTVWSGSDLLSLSFFGAYSAVVVAACWLVVYLPFYALLASSGKWMDWRIWIPTGLSVGGMVPFGLMMMGDLFTGGDFSYALFLILPATVGAVAAAVGCLLLNHRISEKLVRVV